MPTSSEVKIVALEQRFAELGDFLYRVFEHLLAVLLHIMEVISHSFGAGRHAAAAGRHLEVIAAGSVNFADEIDVTRILVFFGRPQSETRPRRRRRGMHVERSV